MKTRIIDIRVEEYDEEKHIEDMISQTSDLLIEQFESFKNDKSLFEYYTEKKIIAREVLFEKYVNQEVLRRLMLEYTSNKSIFLKRSGYYII